MKVRELLSDSSLGLNFEVLQGHNGLENEIRYPRIQRLGLALSGFTAYIHPDRIQIVGGSEIDFLRVMDPNSRRAIIQQLKSLGICCIVITKGLEPPEELLALSSEENVPILRTPALSSVSIVRLTGYLEVRLAPRTTIHGVLLEVYGLGVLLLGPSGIGKSECALELVLKGHRLIADDYVEITRVGLDGLLGAGGQTLKHHMELRGLGIINIQELFGISATGNEQTIDLAVRMERWKPDAEYDRLGLEQSTTEFLGIAVPLIEMPVAPGRNIAALVEVAARIHLLRQRGYQPSREVLNPALSQDNSGSEKQSSIENSKS